MKMRATFTAFLLLAASTTWAADKFQPLNVKAGMNSDVSFTSKWLGASCGDVK